MVKYFCFLFLFITHYTLFPNDSRTLMGSSVEIINNENTNIVMQDEEIIIRLYRDYYEVTVTFNFFNTGADEHLLLGFTVESRYQQLVGNKEWAVVEDFESYINGELITKYEIMEDTEYHGEIENPHTYITHTIWYIREVLFLANQNTVSVVKYKAGYGHGGFIHSAGYIYGTGHNWKGPIGKMSLNIIHDDDIILDYVQIGEFSHKETVERFTWIENGKYLFEFYDIEPLVTDRIWLTIRECNMFNATGNEFGDNWEGWIWNESLLYNDISDIKLYTKNQIRLFVNIFYAIHGYDFKNEIYRNFFQNSRWLPIDKSNFLENPFNDFEIKNIDYLLRLEKMIP